MAKVSIQIVTWNSRRYLSDLFESIFSQKYKDISCLVIDNNSTDGTVNFIREHYPQVYILSNPKNVGFSRAHNQGIIITKSDFILVMNPDIILEPDFLTHAIKIFKKDEKIGSVGGKLLRIEWGDKELNEKIKTDIIDTAGLKILKSRRVINRGEGKKNTNQYNKEEEVFGISGACILYRRKALEDVKIPIKEKKYEYFDEDFFAYKEDVDIAWRLQLRGWKTIYEPKARAYHFRKIKGHKGKLTKVDLKIQANKSPIIAFFSHRNHLWMLLKNSYQTNFLRDILFISLYQFKKNIYLFFFQPMVLLKANISFWQAYRKMLKKREYILKRAKINSQKIKEWFQ